MKKILLSLMVSLLLALPVTADDAAPYTYQDLSESLSLNNTSVLAAVENYKTALLDVKDAKANFHPQIDYTLAASYVLNHQTMTIDTGSVLDSLPSDMTGNLYVYNPYLQYLGYTDNHAPLSDLLTNPLASSMFPSSVDMPIDINAPYLNAEISLVQPVYTWGKLTNSVKMNEEIASARALQITDTEDQMDTQLKASLASLYYIRQMLTVLEEMQSDADELLELAEGSSSTGVLLETDVASARVSAKQIGLTRTQLESQADIIVSSIEVLTGISGLTADMIDYTPDEAYYRELAEADRTMLELQATSNSQATMQMLTHMANAASYGLDAAKGSMYAVPDIALSVGANYSAPLNSSFVDGSSWGVTVAVALQGSIWDGGKKLNDQERAESATNSARIAREEAAGTIRTTLAQNFADMDVALAGIEYQDASIALLESELSLEEARLELGASSRSAVLEKRLELNQARIEKIQHQITLAGCACTIEYLTGYTGVQGT